MYFGRGEVPEDVWCGRLADVVLGVEEAEHVVQHLRVVYGLVGAHLGVSEPGHVMHVYVQVVLMVALPIQPISYFLFIKN